MSSISINYEHGIRQAVQHLAALRHQRIAFVMGPTHLRSASARRAAFEESMREIGLEAPAEFIAGDHTMEGGMQALTRIAALPEHPTAVMYSNDVTAIGVLRRAYELGITTPQALSVVGFDRIRIGQFTIPPLTTVEMCQVELAFEALLHEVESANKTQPKNQYLLDNKFNIEKFHGVG